MDTLPIELIRLIASPAVPSLLLTCSHYLSLLTPCDRYDHMINIGYTIEVYADETFWEKNGLLHNQYGPAWIDNDAIEYYIHGYAHRDDGPAVTFFNGNEEWYQYDRLHRDDGPAVRCGRSEMWFQDGQLHRDDGPAAILYDDDWKLIRQYIPCDHLPKAGVDTRLWYHHSELDRIEKF